MARLKELGSRLANLDTRAARPATKVAAPFYLAPRWRALIAAIIKRRGRRCEDPLCKTPSRTGIRIFGDHVVELQDGGAPFDEANILLRCGSCHTRKTASERARRQATPAAAGVGV
jgi:5-methylcytosine-specific restriction protein A